MGQFLYSMYVHSGPDYPGYKEGSLFHGREVPGRVQVCEAHPYDLKSAFLSPLLLQFVCSHCKSPCHTAKPINSGLNLLQLQEM